MQAPWIAFHGQDDEVCPVAEARTFIAAIPGARFVELPGVTRNYRPPGRRWPQFAAAYARLIATEAQGAPAP